MKKTLQQPIVGIISFSPIHQDARVLRQIAYLSRSYSVIIIGYGRLPEPAEANVEFFSIPAPAGISRHLLTLLLLLLGRLLPDWAYETWYWKRPHHWAALEILIQHQAQIIHANEWNSLPLAVRVAKQTGARLILDLHEYSPLEGEDRWWWRLLYKPAIEYFLQKYNPNASASVTVNETIANRYAEEYTFRPRVIMNTPSCLSMPDFRPTAPERVSLIHHGIAFRNRKLEIMIQVIALAEPRYSLHFMLIENSQGYVTELKDLAEQLAPGRVFFHPPVSPPEIVERISRFDIGIFPLPAAHNFNNQAALPNKFFDFIMAGLAVCIGPSPEMARLARQFGFGFVATSFEPADLAASLNALSASEIDEMKLAAIKARQILNADVEMGKLITLYDELLKSDKFVNSV